VKLNLNENIVSLDVNKIDFDNKELLKELIHELLNTIEYLAKTIQQLQDENQELKDEINRLKGEKGKPKISANKPQNKDESQNKEPKKQSKKWKKRSKKPRIKVDRVVKVPIDKSTLPPDAVFKGYRSRLVQDIIFETSNTEYLIPRFYSPSLGKTFEGELPANVANSEFGANVKALIFSLYFNGRVPENKIKKILEDIAIIISAGEISNILTKENMDVFTAEKEAIFEAGMKQAKYLNLDETGARHQGTNQYLHFTGNEIFGTFFILPDKKRKTVKSTIFGLEDNELINIPLISDDASQFHKISQIQALCWIHEIRHYIKLVPFTDQYRAERDEFIKKLWGFYRLLAGYKNKQTPSKKSYIKRRFKSLFSTKTNYRDLDDRIALTRTKEDLLLLVLDYPEIPLHNNTAERGVREGVLKRKISYGTRSEYGKIMWENMFSLLDTSAKHGISYFRYVRDILMETYSMTRLSELIKRIDSATTY
jgi:regulator of replication initiation timing